jgi:hypothetical protein
MGGSQSSHGGYKCKLKFCRKTFKERALRETLTYTETYITRKQSVNWNLFVQNRHWQRTLMYAEIINIRFP